jgi:hypothetical protein
MTAAQSSPCSSVSSSLSLPLAGRATHASAGSRRCARGSARRVAPHAPRGAEAASPPRQPAGGLRALRARGSSRSATKRHTTRTAWSSLCSRLARMSARVLALGARYAGAADRGPGVVLSGDSRRVRGVSTREFLLDVGPSIVRSSRLRSHGSQQTRGFEHERELSDLREVRTLLEDVATALHRAGSARASVRLGVTLFGRSLPEDHP